MPSILCLQFLPFIVLLVNQLLDNHLIPLQIWGTVQQSYCKSCSFNTFLVLQIWWAIMRYFNNTANQYLIISNGWGEDSGVPQ